MKKILSIAASLAALSLLALSCSPSQNDEPVSPVSYYVLNNGSWGQNNAGIGLYSTESETCTEDAFSKVNSKALGDLGQDMIEFRDHYYIAVNGSQIIYVTDRNLNIVAEVRASLDDGDTYLSPRYFTCDEYYVYVTYYEGYLGRINPDTYDVRTTEVGPNPEGLAYCNGEIFVANSGGYLYPTYNNTISVVNTGSMKEVGTITVNTNPCVVKCSGSTVFVFSYGDYGSIPSKVQYFKTDDLSNVQTLDYDSPSAIDVCDGTLYVMCGGYDSNWNPLPGTIYSYDISAGRKTGTVASDITDAYSLSVTDEYVWAGASDYVTNGDMYCFDRQTGELVSKFDTKGLNPIKVVE